MIVARRLIVGAFGLASFMALVGCGQNADRMAIEAYAQKNRELQAENDRLRGELARAMADRDAAMQRADALQREINRLQGELSKGPQIIERLPEGWQMAGQFRWLPLSTDFLFDSGKATLRPQARAKLQEAVNQINQHFASGQWDVMVLGHTDTDPIKHSGWKDNLDLSVNRGSTVFRELMKLGIQPTRMIAAGQGEFLPVADNASKTGKQENRRVDIIVMPHRPARGASGGEATPAERPVKPPTPRSTPAPAAEPGGATD